MQGDIELPLGNQTYLFNVAKHKQLFELQDRCGVTATGIDGEVIPMPSGPLEIFNRLRVGTWREADVVATIDLGLVGGGMDVVQKNKIMKEFVTDEPKAALAAIATRILMAALFGTEPLKKKRKRKQAVNAKGGSPEPTPTV